MILTLLSRNLSAAIKPKEKMTKLFTKEEMMKMLPVIFSDLSFHSDPRRRIPNNENISRDMYFYVIREMYSDDTFLSKEKLEDGSKREGCFVKGYARDVWDYLQKAYDLIHEEDFEQHVPDLFVRKS